MYRSSHGTGSNALVRIETCPASEQPLGVAQVAQVEAAGERDHKGRFRAGARTAQAAGARAANAKATQLQALAGLGLKGAAPEVLRPFLTDAMAFCAAEVERLAKECGGGICPPNAAALVAQGALAMAGSRAAYAAGDLSLGAKLGAEVRQSLLGARELTVREAQGRSSQPGALDPELAKFFG